jgi:hypothetical protein
MIKAAKIIALAAVVLIAACDNLEPEQNEPTITVTAPFDNEVITVNDTLFVKVDYADDSKLVSYQANITNTNSNVNVFSLNKYVNGTTASLDTFKIMPDTGHYELIIYVGDINDNFTNKIINFTVTP